MDGVGYGKWASSQEREETNVMDSGCEIDTSTPTIHLTELRIPSELVPNDETAMGYFELYFTHVHPYVPVLCKKSFYQQWHKDSKLISPLILEASFAIGARLAGDLTTAQYWLHLATRSSMMVAWF